MALKCPYELISALLITLHWLQLSPGKVHTHLLTAYSARRPLILPDHAENLPCSLLTSYLGHPSHLHLPLGSQLKCHLLGCLPGEGHLLQASIDSIFLNMAPHCITSILFVCLSQQTISSKQASLSLFLQQPGIMPGTEAVGNKY